jgi:hypothetical protein
MIRTVGDLRVYLSRHAQRGWHIDFDKDGKTIVMLYPGDYAFLSVKLLTELHPDVAKNITVLELSATRQIKNWLTRQFKRIA